MAGPGRVLLNSSACPLLTVWRSLSGPEWEELGRTEQGAGLGDHARVLLLPRAFLGSAYGGGGWCSNIQRNKDDSGPRFFFVP